MLTALLAGGCSRLPEGARVGLMDVAWLWPLPQDLDDETFIDGAAVLPRPVFDALERLTVTDEPDDLYASLRVVAARLDPCSKEGFSPGDCQAQIRLVLQPVVDDPEPPGNQPTFTTRDAALHVFFPLEQDALLDLVVDNVWTRVERSIDDDTQLGVHPLLVDNGDRAEAQDRLLAFLDRPNRVTAVGVHGNNQAWSFSGFDLNGQQRLAVDVAEVDLGENGEHDSGDGHAHAQHALSTGGEGAMNASITPAPSSPDAFTLLLRPADFEAADTDTRRAALNAALRVASPNHHNPGTVDCASCHFATPAVVAARRADARLVGPQPDAFAHSQYNLAFSSSFQNTQNIRAFGYFFSRPAVSMRAVNDSAVSADLADALLR